MAKVVYTDWKDGVNEPEIVGVYENNDDGYRARSEKENELKAKGYDTDEEVRVWIENIEIQRSENEKPDLLAKFRGSKQNGILLYLPEIKTFFSVAIGTGDNLLPEDRQAGYDAYLYITTYEYDNGDFEEYDGGDMMYKSSEKNYDEDICNAVKDALEFHYDHVPEYIPLHTFNH